VRIIRARLLIVNRSRHTFDEISGFLQRHLMNVIKSNSGI